MRKSLNDFSEFLNALPPVCLACERPLKPPSEIDSLSFFCSQECAAEWADDEALIQYAMKWKQHNRPV